jgi:hypothetical protein
MELLGNILGIMGTFCFLGAYYMLQSEKWAHNAKPYLWANFSGAVLLLASLMIDWNLPAFLLEAAWGLISMWGLFKLYKART